MCRSRLLAIPLVLRFIRPDRPPKPLPAPVRLDRRDALRAWVVVPAVHLRLVPQVGRLVVATRSPRSRPWLHHPPFVLLPGLGSGCRPDEHLRRLVRIRVYVLAMCVRVLLLVNFAAVLASWEVPDRAARLPARGRRLGAGPGGARDDGLDL